MADRPRRPDWSRALGSQRLLVSGFGKWGGGIYDLTTGTPVALDDIPTSGLAVGGDRLWRVLRAPGEQTSLCELLVYDDRGVRAYQRLDPVRDPHDVCWHDGTVYVTSSWDTTIWRLDDDGVLRRHWTGSAMPDSWHINSLAMVDGQLHVSAFGRFDRYKAWRGEVGRTAGFVMNLDTGRDVLAGLAHPHNPIWAGDRWYVCESTRGTLTECDRGGRVIRRAPVRRFARGMALSPGEPQEGGPPGRWAFVGGNAHRQRDDDRASVAVIDLSTFEHVDNLPLPCLEIYDIRLTPAPLARAAAVGFGANPARAVEQQRSRSRNSAQRSARGNARVQLVTPRVAHMLEQAGRVLPKDDAARCAVRGTLPATAVAGEVLAFAVTVENRSKLTLATVPPHPIRIGARWVSPNALVRNPLVPLPDTLAPHQSGTAEVLLEVPEIPGDYEVRVALHQSDLGWFGLRIQGTVSVLASRAGLGLLGTEGGEQHDIADRGGAGEQLDQTIHTDAEPTGGR